MVCIQRPDYGGGEFTSTTAHPQKRAVHLPELQGLNPDQLGMEKAK